MWIQPRTVPSRLTFTGVALEHQWSGPVPHASMAGHKVSTAGSPAWQQTHRCRGALQRRARSCRSTVRSLWTEHDQPRRLTHRDGARRRRRPRSADHTSYLAPAASKAACQACPAGLLPLTSDGAERFGPLGRKLRAPRPETLAAPSEICAGAAEISATVAEISATGGGDFWRMQRKSPAHAA